MPREWRMEGNVNALHYGTDCEGQCDAAVQPAGSHVEVDPTRVN
ncbi:hypothetical protein [uncultured Tateyamaria sp.]|nr:hypothetical protein [uncultured Tateyamaria sp.]